MKRHIEIFYDYACPFSRKSHTYLARLLPSFPHIEPVWRPCESYPRPESHELHQHSDLCIRAMFYAAEQGVDLWKFHDLAYALMHDTEVNAEDIDSLANGLSELLDADGLRQALSTGKHIRTLFDANKYAFELTGVWALPSYRMDGRKLDSIEEIGVTEDQLREFLESR